MKHNDSNNTIDDTQCNRRPTNAIFMHNFPNFSCSCCHTIVVCWVWAYGGNNGIQCTKNDHNKTNPHMCLASPNKLLVTLVNRNTNKSNQLKTPTRYL